MTNWDKLTARAGWGMLLVFVALSSYLNARHAQLGGNATTEAVVFHAGIPAVLLVAGLFAELVALAPGVHRAAKAVTVTTLGAIFAVTLIASYIAVLAVIARWNPHAPAWVNCGLAAVPDAVMIMAGTVVLSLRVRRQSVAAAPSRTRAPSRLGRLSDAFVARAEAAMAIPQVVAVADPSAMHSTDPVAETDGGSVESVAEVREGVCEPVRERSVRGSAKRPGGIRVVSAKGSVKPVADPALEPFMEAAAQLAEAGVVRGKRAEDYARILQALDAGWSPTKIKSALGYSQSTTVKVIEAASVGGDRPALTVV